MNSTQEPTPALPLLLQDLSRLSLPELHQEAQRAHGRLAGSEWHMAALLLAVERQGLPRSLGCSSTVQYAVIRLQMDAHKASELLGAALVLENLPRISEAFRQGRLGWSKIRELKRVVCPQTEEMWLDYALQHTAHQIQKQVTLSPREFKRRAMAANRSASEAPSVMSDVSQVAHASQASGPAQAAQGHQAAQTAPPVSAVDPTPQAERARPLPETRAKPSNAPPVHPPTAMQASDAPTSTASPEAVQDLFPVPRADPKVVRVVLEFTPDEYALWDQAERLVRQRHQGRMKRNEVAALMARIVLDGATPHTRARHQVLVHRDEEGKCWYETDRGMLPANPDQLEKQALPKQTLDKQTLDKQTLPEQSSRRNAAKVPRPPGRGRRSPVPATVLKALYARAGARCEKPGCGSTHYLRAHHRVAVSDGGTHELESLELLCAGCHDVTHGPDFETRSNWREARERKVRRRRNHGSA